VQPMWVTVDPALDLRWFISASLAAAAQYADCRRLLWCCGHCARTSYWPCKQQQYAHSLPKLTLNECLPIQQFVPAYQLSIGSSSMKVASMRLCVALGMLAMPLIACYYYY
jgi:hypothetical protein